MFELFEHKADVGVRGIGKTKEEAFAECAKAMFSVMADIKKVIPKKWDNVELNAGDLAELLIKFLNELLYLKDVNGVLYSNFKVYITGAAGFELKGKVGGDKINKKKQLLRGDVKAASYHQLRVAEEKGKWIAQCVVDV